MACKQLSRLIFQDCDGCAPSKSRVSAQRQSETPLLAPLRAHLLSDGARGVSSRNDLDIKLLAPLRDVRGDLCGSRGRRAFVCAAGACSARRCRTGAAAAVLAGGVATNHAARQCAGPDFVSEGGVTPAAVTNAALELKLYDPDAASIPGYRANPPPRTVARDWGGPSCIQLAGHNQNPPPQRVANGEPTDPPNLWTGVCHTAVAVDAARPVATTSTSRAARGSAGSRACRASTWCGRS